jgi:signal transduction histidine kinase
LSELIRINKEIASELFITYKELIFQDQEKEILTVNLLVANKNLSEELVIAHKELLLQYEEKTKRADELIIANKELAFQNSEKAKRADELIIANKELVYQNEEKAKRAEELIIANKELAYQNKEKAKRAEELIIANKELAYQNEEKEKRATELITINKELEQYSNANKELMQFAYTASHQLQEPLRTVTNFTQIIEEEYEVLLDENAQKHLHIIKDAIKRMSILINSLLDFSRLGLNKLLISVDCNKLIADVIADLDTLIKTTNTVIEVAKMPVLNIYDTEIRQLFQNLIINSIKFQKKNSQPKIQIWSQKIDKKWRFSVSDNGIGIAPIHFDRVFEIFQRLHTNEEGYKGTGIGLAYCKKIVQFHKGDIWIESNKKEGVTFHFTIPILTV